MSHVRGLGSISLAILAFGFAGAGVRAQAPDTVWVREFDGRAPVGDAAMGAFAAQLVRLELARMPRLTAVPATQPRKGATDACPERSVKPPPEPVRRAGARAPIAFSITGRFDDTSPAVDFQLVRCDAEGPVLLLPGRQRIDPLQALRDLLTAARLISDRLDEEYPREPVLVEILPRPGSRDERGVAESLARRLANGLWDSADLEPADSAAPWAWALVGEVESGGGTATARIVLRRARGDSVTELDRLTVTQPIASVPEFADSVGRRSLALLNQWRYAPRASDAGAAPVSADSLLAGARHALCNEGAERGCTPNGDAAVATLRTLLARDSTDGRAWRLLALAERGRLRPYAAVSAFERAVQAADAARAAGQPYPDTLETKLRAELAGAYLSVGNTDKAAATYKEALKLGADPVQTSIAWSRALRTAGRQLDALEAVAGGVRVAGATPELRGEMDATLRALTIAELHGQTARLQAICRTDPTMLAPCGDALVRVARAELRRPGSGEVRAGAARDAEELASAAVALDPPQPAPVIDASLLLAGLRIGVATPTLSPDGPFTLTFPGFDREKADEQLRRAEAYGKDEVPPLSRPWLAALRAQFWLAARDYARAREYATQAPQTTTGPLNRDILLVQADLLRAQQLQDSAASTGTPQLLSAAADRYGAAARGARARLARAQTDAYVYYRAAINGRTAIIPEERGTAAATVTQEIADIARANHAAGLALGTLCVETLYDFPCGLGATAGTLRARGANVDDTLNAIESAVLAERPLFADSLLAAVANSPVDRCLVPVPPFYRVWRDLQRGIEADTDFALWQKATLELRAPPAVRFCWLFRGASARLGREPAPAGADLLLEMIAAMQDNSVSLPPLRH